MVLEQERSFSASTVDTTSSSIAYQCRSLLKPIAMQYGVSPAHGSTFELLQQFLNC
jgi:hypothetical protein